MKTDNSDNMFEEYNFDYSKAKQNKYAKDFYKSSIRVYVKEKLLKEMKPVWLDIDILKHFKTTIHIN